MIAGGDDDASLLGDIAIGMAANGGIAAIVVDGLVRDLEGLDRVGIPVVARGLSPNSPFKNGPARSASGSPSAGWRSPRATSSSATRTASSSSRVDGRGDPRRRSIWCSPRKRRWRPPSPAGATLPAWIEGWLLTNPVRHVD